MFSGIVQGTAEISVHEIADGSSKLHVKFPAEGLAGIDVGASIAIDGVCLTAAQISATVVEFDLVGETLAKTTLGDRRCGDKVNFERAATFGSEIGGHEMSGHISTIAEVVEISHPDNNYVLTLSVSPEWMRYILPKGFIGLDGASLTVANTNPAGTFSVWLIPETLQRTCFSQRAIGATVNLEIDAKTQAIVDTVERYMEARN